MGKRLKTKGWFVGSPYNRAIRPPSNVCEYPIPIKETTLVFAFKGLIK